MSSASCGLVAASQRARFRRGSALSGRPERLWRFRFPDLILGVLALRSSLESALRLSRLCHFREYKDLQSWYNRCYSSVQAVPSMVAPHLKMKRRIPFRCLNISKLKDDESIMPIRLLPNCNFELDFGGEYHAPPTLSPFKNRYGSVFFMKNVSNLDAS